MTSMTGIDQSLLTRRRVLTGAAASIACTMLETPARAKTPMSNTQAPAYYRFRLGDFEASVISDGPLHMGEPSGNIFTGVTKEEVVKDLAGNLLPTDNISLEQNALVVNTGDRVVLFDTGIGSVRMMGSDSGRLITNLKSAGIDPKDVDAVVLTHAHPDHCWALQADDGTRNFPNAQIYMAQADLDFWTDEGKLRIDAIKPMVEGTRRHLIPNRDRLTFVRDGQEFLPGIQAIAAPGHTVGHTIYMITSRGKTICNAGDIAHHHIMSVETPRREFAYDTDGQQAVASRLRTFDMLASGRVPVITYHFPWPGIGHIAKRGDAYHYLASPMRMVL
jgi:glyoxylase-like metal-dependent hydrolase (beta-lactamase superfamily II)